jgi:signal transduction histidine kinase
MDNVPPADGERGLRWMQRLSVQLVLVIIVTVFVSFLFLGGITAARTRAIMAERELYYLATLSSTYSLHLSQQVDKTRSIVNAYSFDVSLREALVGGSTRQAFFLLGYAREASAYLEDIVLADPSGTVLVSGSLRMEGEDISPYPAFTQSVDTAGSSIGTVARASRAGAPSIGISAPIIADGEVIGALVGIFNLERFGIDFLTSSLPGDLSQVFVIDAEGKYVIHPDRRLIMQAVEPSLLERLVSDGSGRRSEGNFIAGGRYFAVQPTAIIPWYLGVSLDSQAVSRPIARILRISLAIAFLVAAALTFVLYYHLRRLIVKPVQSLRSRVEAFDRDLSPIRREFSRRNELQLLEQQLVLMSSDIAERNQRISAMYRQLLQAEKLASLGSLVAGLSHEMNTPLGNAVTLVSNCREKIRDFARLASDNALTRSEFSGFVDYLSDAVGHVNLNINRAAGLVRDLKQVAVDQGSMRRRKFDLRVVADEVISTISHKVKRRPIAILNELNRDILIDSYPGPLEQVLTNLLSNSLNHGFDEDEAGEIRIAGRLENGRVFLEYRDNGRGIDRDLAEKVFDPFYTTKMGQGGTGLGLFLVQNIIRGVFNGDIRVESAVGEGVLFSFDFPAEPPEKPRENLDFLSI